MSERLVLVLGGTRSGKSTFALQRVRELSADRPIAYLATAEPGDPELDDRINRHRAARPADWPTIDVGTDLPAAVKRAGADHTLLLDGLTLWLSSIAPAPVGQIDALLAGPVARAMLALSAHPAPVVVVSDEIGLGMVPMDEGARAFRDLQGIVHQQLAALADEVLLTVAGLPLTLKTS